MRTETIHIQGALSPVLVTWRVTDNEKNPLYNISTVDFCFEGPGGMTAAALDATVGLSSLTADYTTSESGSYTFSGIMATGYHIIVYPNINGDVNITLSSAKIGYDTTQSVYERTYQCHGNRLRNNRQPDGDRSEFLVSQRHFSCHFCILSYISLIYFKKMTKYVTCKSL